MSGEPTNEEPTGTPETPPERTTPERRDSGLTPVQEAGLIRRCLKNKEWREQRWPTRATPDEIEKLKEERPLTFIELAMQSVGTDLTDKDRRVRRIAVKNLVVMEGQNQKDDHEPKEDKDNGQGPIQLVRVVVGDRKEVAEFESIKMKQLGEIVENEPLDEEIDDVDGSSG